MTKETIAACALALWGGVAVAQTAGNSLTGPLTADQQKALLDQDSAARRAYYASSQTGGAPVYSPAERTLTAPLTADQQKFIDDLQHPRSATAAQTTQPYGMDRFTPDQVKAMERAGDQGDRQRMRWQQQTGGTMQGQARMQMQQGASGMNTSQQLPSAQSFPAQEGSGQTSSAAGSSLQYVVPAAQNRR